jgi:hypothetical protein
MLRSRLLVGVMDGAPRHGTIRIAPAALPLQRLDKAKIEQTTEGLMASTPQCTQYTKRRMMRLPFELMVDVNDSSVVGIA